MAYFKVRVWKADEIIAIAKRKGEFIVDRNMYRFSILRQKLRKMAKDTSIPLKFNGCTQKQIFYSYAPEKLIKAPAAMANEISIKISQVMAESLRNTNYTNMELIEA